MKTLYLARHAESAAARTADLARTLTIRGRSEARQIAAALVARGEIPERIFTSRATRAAETAEIFRLAMGFPDAHVEQLDALYEIGHNGLLAIVRGFDDRLARIMIVGHNPALSDAAEILSPGSTDGMAAGAVLGIDFDGPSWKSVACGSVRIFESPENHQARSAG